MEEGTPFADRELHLPDEDTEYQMYEDTAEILASYGYRQYEISNYAKPGFACRHNVGYWKRTEYLGFGLGAASLFRLDGRMTRFSNTRELSVYLRDSKTPGRIRENIEAVSRQEAMEEFLFLGLRMTDGISAQEFEQQFGERLERRYGDFLRKYEKTGHLERYLRTSTERLPGNHACQNLASPSERNLELFWRFTREGIHVSNWILADVLQDDR